jgi:hypothetical protein
MERARGPLDDEMDVSATHKLQQEPRAWPPTTQCGRDVWSVTRWPLEGC